MAALSAGADAPGLEPRQQAMLEYARRLTIAPGSLGEGDVRELRGFGLSDSAIHDLAAVTAYFNFVNRIALGLGVELEPDLR